GFFYEVLRVCDGGIYRGGDHCLGDRGSWERVWWDVGEVGARVGGVRGGFCGGGVPMAVEESGGYGESGVAFGGGFVWWGVCVAWAVAAVAGGVAGECAGV